MYEKMDVTRTRFQLSLMDEAIEVKERCFGDKWREDECTEEMAARRERRATGKE